MASSVEICNMALSLLGQEPVMTLDDTSKSSRICKRLYEPTLEALLRSYPWTFAIKRVILSRDTDTPAFGFKYQFTIPSDCMRIVSINIPDGLFNIESNKILTNYDVIQMRYVYKTASAAEFDAQFIHVLSLRLAKVMCQSLTADPDLFSRLAQLEAQALLAAQNTNAIETSTQPVEEGPWIPSRYL